MQDGGRDLLDRLRRRVEHRNAVLLHQVLGFAHFVPAVVELRIAAARPPLLANFAQPLGLNGEAEQPLAQRRHRSGQASIGEVVGRQREVRRADAELQRQVQRRRRLAAARYADEDHLCLVEVARRRAVVVRLREIDRLHAREILVAVGDSVRASRGVRALGAELRLERRDEDLEHVERQRLRVATDGLAHRIVDHRADDDRPAAFGGARGVHLPHGIGSFVHRVDEWNRDPPKLDVLELGQQAVAEHLRGNPGAVGDEEHRASVAHRGSRSGGGRRIAGVRLRDRCARLTTCSRPALRPPEAPAARQSPAGSPRSRGNRCRMTP